MSNPAAPKVPEPDERAAAPRPAPIPPDMPHPFGPDAPNEPAQRPRPGPDAQPLAPPPEPAPAPLEKGVDIAPDAD